MRNFLYNKSDILIALIIIAIAAVIIWTRVDAIMNAGDEGKESPVAASEENPAADAPPVPDTPEGEQPPAEGEAPPADAGTDEAPPEGEAAPPEGEVLPEDGEEAPADGEPVEFTVEMGSTASTVANDLESSGLVESAGAFLDELKAQGAETKLKAGTFEIAPGTSIADIVKKLTNR